MRADAAHADRQREVRAAARGWQRAGAIDEKTRRAIDAEYADDRARLGPIFRVVAFGFSFLALNAFFGVIGLCSGSSGGFGVACFFFAIVLVVATELLIGPAKRADSGIETATALLAVGYVLVALGVALEKASVRDQVFLTVMFSAATLLAAAACARWGSWLLGAISVASLFFFLARLPAGRAWWMIVAAILAPLFLRASESARFPPAHRRSFQLGLVLALCAFYMAVHVGSWDSRVLEWFADFRESDRSPILWLRWMSIAATAGVPVAVIAFGIATRRAYLLTLGILLGVASLVTLRFYVHVAPAWVVLTGSGAAALLAALALRRFLSNGAQKERGGFTAEPLFEDPKRRHAAEVLGAIATFAPDARTIPQADDPLRPGGGRYGGGGASGDF